MPAEPVSLFEQSIRNFMSLRLASLSYQTQSCSGFGAMFDLGFSVLAQQATHATEVAQCGVARHEFDRHTLLERQTEYLDKSRSIAACSVADREPRIAAACRSKNRRHCGSPRGG
jgi:hypothetical protein